MTSNWDMESNRQCVNKQGENWKSLAQHVKYFLFFLLKTAYFCYSALQMLSSDLLIPMRVLSRKTQLSFSPNTDMSLPPLCASIRGIQWKQQIFCWWNSQSWPRGEPRLVATAFKEWWCLPACPQILGREEQCKPFKTPADTLPLTDQHQAETGGLNFVLC